MSRKSISKKVAPKGDLLRRKGVKAPTVKKRQIPPGARDKTAVSGVDAKPSPVERLFPANEEVIVRMYRQGLGDCFLLAFATSKPEHPYYVLVDCGVHAREDSGAARLNQVMQNLKLATGSQLNVAVATHEHADHLSGFVQKGTPFLDDDFRIDELWVAWTEKRGDSQADDLRKKRGAARELIDKALEECQKRAALGATQVHDQIAGLNDFEEPFEGTVDEHAVRVFLQQEAPGSAELRHYVNENLFLNGTVGVAKKSGKPKKPSSNELALALLKAKVKDNVEYCEPGQVLQMPRVEKVRAFVLGPPRNTELLKKDLPTKIRGAKEGDQEVYKEVYLSGEAGSQALALSPVLRIDSFNNGVSLPEDWRFPFQTSFRREFEIARGQKYRWKDQGTIPQTTIDLVTKSYLAKDAEWRRIDADWLGSAGQLALNLDSDTNNTSLALAFECGEPGQGRILLFPGDAQVGNWLSWRDQEYGIGKNTTTADDLLKRTLIYKVGHHGSHNATVRRDPRETTTQETMGVPYGLELMNDILAMIPVDWAAAKKKMPDPWRMPHEPLYRRLREKSRRRVWRSDNEMEPLSKTGEGDKDLTPTDTEWKPVPGLKGLRWRRSAETFSVGTTGPLYYEVAIPFSQT